MGKFSQKEGGSLIFDVELRTEKAISKAGELDNRLKVLGRNTGVYSQKIGLISRAIKAGVSDLDDIFNPNRQKDIAKQISKYEALEKAKKADFNLNKKIAADNRKNKVDFVKSLESYNINSKLKQEKITQGKKLKTKSPMQFSIDDSNKELLRLKIQEKANKSAKEYSKLQDKLARQARHVRMSYLGVGFTFLFMGMAIKRVTDQALKSLFENYKLVMGETSEFNKLTNQLAGAWTFLKFTLMDALMQTGVLQTVIGWIINITNGLAKWAAEHPNLAKFIVIGLAITAILSVMAMVIGQLVLAWVSLGTAITGTAIAGGVATNTFLTYMIGGFTSFFGWLKPLWIAFSGFFMAIFNKMGLKLDWFTKESAGKFLGFAVAGALSGKLLYEMFSSTFYDITKYGGQRFAAFITALGYSFQDLGQQISTIFKDIADIWNMLKSGNLKGASAKAGSALDRLKTMFTSAPTMFSDYYGVALDEIKTYDEIMAQRNPEQIARLKQINAILAGISAVGISGGIGAFSGGTAGAIGALLGSSVSAGLSAFQDIKDLSDTINPDFQVESLTLQEMSISKQEAQLDETKKQTQVLSSIYKDGLKIYGLTPQSISNLTSTTGA